MTTEPQQNQQIDAAEVWRAIGRLEGLHGNKIERINRIHNYHEHDSRDEGIDRINKKPDKLFYAAVGMGVAMIASIWASNLFGG